MQKLSPSEIPFSTDKGILAFCLYIAGVPFENSKQPLRNEYTREFLVEWLKKRGVTGQVDLFEKAKEAIGMGLRGHIRYIFKRTRELPKLLKVFNAQQAEIDAPDSKVDAAAWELELLQKVAKGEVEPVEALIRLNCVSLKMNVLFRNIYKELPAHFQIENSGTARTFDTTAQVQTRNGPKTVPAKGVEYPGFKQVSTNASDKTLRKLKLR
jgi:hypothetical protein